jgi:hypothetical protein
VLPKDHLEHEYFCFVLFSRKIGFSSFHFILFFFICGCRTGGTSASLVIILGIINNLRYVLIVAFSCCNYYFHVFRK